jgi:hypothetical protein
MNILRRLAALALVAAAAAACTPPAAGDPPRVAVVLGGRAAGDPALLAQARRLAAQIRSAEVQLRVPRTPTEELGVTHLLAAAGYDAVVGVDLDRQVSVAPVARRFPRMHFVTARPATLAAAVCAATTCSGRRSARG